MKKLVIMLLLLLSCKIIAEKGTTGKIYGKITGEDGKPLPAASIVIEGEKLGAASDAEGNYFIINIPPGSYTLEVRRIGYMTAVKKNIEVQADKSIKVDFELAVSDSYDLDEKAEQFYLQKLSEEQVKKLMVVKEQNKLKYQQMLTEIFYKSQFDQKSEQMEISDSILKLTKKIDESAKLYKAADEEELKAEYEKHIYDMLTKRFGLIEKKLEHQIKELTLNVEKLRKELMSFRADKDKIIKGQFESFVK